MLRLVGWRGASIFAGVHALRGANGSIATGDIQGYSNIDADEFDTLAELWFEQRLLSERIRLKVGRVDANTEFAWVGAGGEFINSSAGFSPTILFLPTYPDPAPSLNFFLHPTEAVRLGIGVYERELDSGAAGGRSRARFTIGEAGFSDEGSGLIGPRRVALGAWHDDAPATTFDGRVSSGTTGLFALGEQRFVVSPSGRWVDAFVQLGHADQSVGEFANHWSLGVVTPSPFGANRGDLVGAMLSVVDLSDAPAAGFSANEEVFEVFYAIPIAGFLRLKPDLQFVSSPGGENGTSIIGTLRVELAF
jgi:carbohydrate-selective porin OprB